MMRLPHPVVIERPGWVLDRYKARTKDWTVNAPVSTDGFFQPRAGAEDETGENVQTTSGVLFLAPGTAITGDDRVTVLGGTFEVVGPPEVWDGGTGFSGLAHVKAVLRKVAG